MRGRSFWVIPISVLILLAAPGLAYANSPPPDTTITVKLSNAPADTAYVDILVDKTLPKVNTETPNPEPIEKFPAMADSDLVRYDDGAYVSYSLYYQPQTYNVRQNNSLIYFPAEGNRYEASSSSEIKTIKIVLLDGAGKIQQVSDVISLSPGDNLHALTPTVLYDCNKNSAQVSFPFVTKYGLIGLIVTLLVSAVIRIVFSTGVEVLIALPFRIRPLWIVFVVNAVTQISISIGIPLLTMAVSYPVSVAVFEALVYGLEFLAYMKWTKDPKWAKILVYTVAANTASLALGLFMNSLGLFWA